MAASPTTLDVQPAKPQFLVIHDSEEGELENNHLDIAAAIDSPKKEKSKQEEIIFLHDRDTPEDDSTSTTSSSADGICISVEGPADTDDLLSSSALTAASSTQAPDDSPFPSADDAPHDPADDPDADPDPSTQRRSRVRFRSRVRITSGLHHYRAHARERAAVRDLHPNTTHARRLSAASSTTSLASSASSSISAPLRSPLTEESCTPGWGTLGTRVNLFAVSNRDRQAKAQHGHGRGRRRRGSDPPATERTALLHPDGHGRAPPDYDGSAYDSDSVYTQSDEESVYGYDDEALLSRHIDLVFGKWPGRLFNRQWWWWQLQPIMCCLDESDGED